MHMRRVAAIAFLILAAAAGVSAWLVIDARSDAPEPVVQLRPQQEDDDQQAQASQPEPSQPDQEDEADEAEEAVESEGESEQQSEPEAAESDDAAEEPAPESSDPEEPAAEEDADAASAADLLIAALDVPRGSLPNAQPAVATYVVAEEDTLSTIAEALGVTVDELIAANDLENPDAITVGQVLSAPGQGQPERAYIALEIAPTLTDEGVVYGTVLDLDSDTVHSAVAAIAESLMLVSACIDGALRVYVQHEDSLGHEGGIGALTRVYWSVDGGPLRTSQWKQSGGALESIEPSRLFDELQDAESLWWRTRLFEASFQVAAMFPSDVQANLINCGR